METKTVRLGDVANVNPRLPLTKGTVARKIPMEALTAHQRHIDSFFYEKYSGGVKFQNGDTLVARITPSLENGKTSYVDLLDKDEIAFGSTEFIVLRAKNKLILPKFLYYISISDDFRQMAIQSMTGTSGRQRVQSESVINYEFSLPDIEKQTAIVDLLDAIDQKLKINQQINKNLLKLGMNIAIRTSNINKNTTCRISDMKDFLTVSDHVANGSFKTLKDNVTIVDKPDYSLFLRNTDLKRNLMGDKRWITKHSYDFLKKSHLYGGEVIISNVGDVGSVHRVPYLDEHMVAGNNVIFIQSADSWITDYLYLYFLSNIGQHALSTITSGSAQQKFNKTDFRAIELPIIPKNFVKKNLTPILKKIDSNRVEEDCLITLRDLLLPRLLSGEIDLSILEEVLKNAK
ncbi:restriction endonuclease subunit S [Loigolactobacillus coryniformis]|uniref:Uncharacterized protein n=2 Tax=Loigolactobacillus coryniformis TaxID=1610 RepID=A0A2D1KSQ6_9LACO|nr:restriction endonuclease subunit S [Loigolactobacillus coryniformis]ATO45102.1 hypothetical protein LC20004_14315 [Loigolactobacillus coryniformis subsp. torquens DSM 20004 = KCTC 3535]KRK76814.1 restriction modification system DNA specificity domain protein [Loigolactobacillus coryniformis subsp. torquens DSM 20004 = KCTC 3535]